MLCQLLFRVRIWVRCRWARRRCIIIINLMVVLMRKLAVCFTTCDVLCASSVFLSFFFKSGGLTHVFSSWRLFWTGSMCVSVYGEFLCLIRSHLYGFMRSVSCCMRCVLSRVSLPGLQPVFLYVYSIPCLTSLFCHLLSFDTALIVLWLSFPWN